MYYVKELIHDNYTVTVPITDKNVYCRCPHCGKEVQVDIGAMIEAGISDVLKTAVACDRCDSIFSKALNGGADI